MSYAHSGGVFTQYYYRSMAVAGTVTHNVPLDTVGYKVEGGSGFTPRKGLTSCDDLRVHV